MGGLGLSAHSPSPFVTFPIPSEEGPRLTRSQDTRDCLPCPCLAVKTWEHVAPKEPISPPAAEGASTSVQLSCRRGQG